MKIIYQPTEEELIEMGFNIPEFRDYFELKLYDKKNTIRWYRQDTYRKTDAQFYLTNYDGEYMNLIKFYPSSKQALLEFISNFSPNE